MPTAVRVCRDPLPSRLCRALAQLPRAAMARDELLPRRRVPCCQTARHDNQSPSFCLKGPIRAQRRTTSSPRTTSTRTTFRTTSRITSAASSAAGTSDRRIWAAGRVAVARVVDDVGAAAVVISRVAGAQRRSCTNDVGAASRSECSHRRDGRVVVSSCECVEPDVTGPECKPEDLHTRKVPAEAGGQKQTSHIAFSAPAPTAHMLHWHADLQRRKRADLQGRASTRRAAHCASGRDSHPGASTHQQLAVCELHGCTKESDQ